MSKPSNPKLIEAAESLGLSRTEAKLFVQLMARFAKLEMNFFEAVETAITLIATEGSHIYMKNVEKS